MKCDHAYDPNLKEKLILYSIHLIVIFLLEEKSNYFFKARRHFLDDITRNLAIVSYLRKKKKRQRLSWSWKDSDLGPSGVPIRIESHNLPLKVWNTEAAYEKILLVYYYTNQSARGQLDNKFSPPTSRLTPKTLHRLGTDRLDLDSATGFLRSQQPFALLV